MALERKREEPQKLTELVDEDESIGEARPEAEREAEVELSPEAKRELAAIEEAEQDDQGPVQLGSKRFVYAAYMAGAVAVTFFLKKGISAGWERLSLWKPAFGDPTEHEMLVMVFAAVAGAATAFYFYRDARTRSLAEEVASELGKVTWPNKEQVTNGTAVVVVTTLLATLFFALMDRFWGFLTNLVYGT